MKEQKQVVPVRLAPSQRERIKAKINGSTLLDESKFIRLAIEWLLLYDVGEVLAIMESTE